MNGSLAVHGDFRRVGMPAAFKDDPRLAERPAMIDRLREMNVGSLVFSDGPGEIDGTLGVDSQGGAARGLCIGAAGNAQRIREAVAPIRGTAEP